MPQHISAFFLKPPKLFNTLNSKLDIYIKRYNKMIKDKTFLIQLCDKVLGPEKEHESSFHCAAYLKRKGVFHPSQYTQAVGL